MKKPAPVKLIRKLLRTATSPNVHEAALAREYADRLIGQYDLDEDDLVETFASRANLAPGREGNQRAELARVVARSRKCTVTATPSYFEFQGIQEAATDASQLFSALVRIVEEHAELPSSDPKDEFLWRTCFWLGFVSSIQKKLDPEHGSIPPEALARIVQNAAIPPDVARAAEGLDERRNREIREPAYAAGFDLGQRLDVPCYREK